ncbi:MAG: hypothetical protein JSU94_21970 [Phycisphaerales bacterium]|nr:MAG: hypothetical protein JSU94_21970 [Phycisphaerales bacterium]
MNTVLFRPRSLVLLVAVILFALAVPRGARSMDSTSNPQEVIKTLRMIKAGYEASNTEKNVLMKGKIFYVQRAEEGKTIPENYRDDPDWLDFMYARKGERWRYEQQFSIDPGVQLTRLCDSEYRYWADERVGRDIETLEIAPNTDRAASAYAGLMTRFYVLDWHTSGYENVPVAMDTMIDLIGSEKKEEDRTTIEVIKKEGVFEISRSNGMYCEMTVRIDPNQGFNMTSSNTLVKWRGGLTSVTSKEVKFEQVKPGFWLPRNAEIHGNDSGVVLESKLVIDEYSAGDFEFDERLFSRESIKLAPNARIVDRNFTPPLEYHVGAPLQALDQPALDKMIQSPPTQVVDKLSGTGGSTPPDSAEDQPVADTADAASPAGTVGTQGWTVVVCVFVFAVLGMCVYLLSKRYRFRQERTK